MRIAHPIRTSSSTAGRAALRIGPAVEIGLALLLGSATFVLYVRTLAPSLLPGDSGEFQALAYLLGHTHPTGYPIYLLLARLFTFLPVESAAYRVNLFSALMATLAVAGVYLGGRLLTRRRGPALLGAAGLAVSTTFWSQALIAEVYTAGAAFLAGVLLALLAWVATDRRGFLFGAGLLGGLSLGVHLTAALLAPAVLVYLFIKARGERAAWMAAICGALLGLLLFMVAFLYLDWRAPIANFLDAAVLPGRSVWGLSTGDLDTTWERFWFNLSGRQFQDRMFNVDTLPKNLFAYGSGLFDEFHPIAVLLAALGFVWLALRRRAEAALLSLAILGQWIFTFTYDIWDLYVFFIPGYVLLALLVAAGAAGVQEAVEHLSMRWPAARPTLASLLTGVLLFVTMWPMLSPHWTDVRAGRVPDFGLRGYPVDRFNLTGLHNQVTAMAAQLPPTAIVFVGWPELYPLYYAAHVEQDRADLTFIEAQPYGPSDDRSSTVGFVAAHIDDRPIYFAECLAALRAAGYRCEPTRVGAGLLQRVTK